MSQVSGQEWMDIIIVLARTLGIILPIVTISTILVLKYNLFK